MKYNIFSFTLFILISNSVLVTSAFCENQPKEFPEYYCRLTLPSEAWKWDNPDETPNILAIARSENGLTFLFGASLLKDDYAISDKFIAGIEKGQLDHPEVSKTGSRKLTYCGVPCYQLETFMSDTNIHTINRFLNGHSYSYFLGIMYPEEYAGEVLTIERMFDCFVFTSPPVVKLRPENKAYEEGQWIGQIAGRIMFWTILGYILFVIIRNIFRKRTKKINEGNIIQKKSGDSH